MMLAILAAAGAMKAAPISGSDVIEFGRMIGDLDEWRAILMVMIALLFGTQVFAIINRTLDRRENRLARLEYMKATDRLAGAVDRLTELIDLRHMDSIKHDARVESALNRIEPALDHLERMMTNGR